MESPRLANVIKGIKTHKLGAIEWAALAEWVSDRSKEYSSSEETTLRPAWMRKPTIDVNTSVKRGLSYSGSESEDQSHKGKKSKKSTPPAASPTGPPVASPSPNTFKDILLSEGGVDALAAQVRKDVDTSARKKVLKSRKVRDERNSKNGASPIISTQENMKSVPSGQGQSSIAPAKASQQNGKSTKDRNQQPKSSNINRARQPTNQPKSDTSSKPKALFVEGLTSEDKKSKTRVMRLVNVKSGYDVVFTHTNHVLLYATTHEIWRELQKPNNNGLVIRPTRAIQRPSGKAIQIVCVGVPEAISDQEFENHLKLPVRRLHSNRTQKPTQKLKIRCSDRQQQQQMLKDGITFNDVKYKCEEYQDNGHILQCFKCQQYGHHSNECKQEVSKCARCAGDHRRKDCPAKDQPKCANCTGDHTSTYRGCVAAKTETWRKRTEGLTYAQATKKGDQLDACRLVTAISTTMDILFKVYTDNQCAGLTSDAIFLAATTCVNNAYGTKLDPTTIQKKINKKQQ